MSIDLRKHPDPPKKQKNKRLIGVPWKIACLAATCLGLFAYYLIMVAPGRIPVPQGLTVPFPELTRFLEAPCLWCGEHPIAVAAIAAGLLVPGIFFHFTSSAERYYLALIVVVSLVFGVTYLSISAPIDRLLHAVENAIPEDRRLPEHNKPSGGERRKR